MRVREAQLQTLAHAILTALAKQGFMKTTADQAVLQQKIVTLLAKNFEQEAEIEAEAERLAEAHARKTVGMDQRRIIQGIMERIAKERDFAL